MMDGQASMADRLKPAPNVTSFLTQIGPGRSIQGYQHDEVVYLQGSQADAIFYVVSGMVKVTVASKRATVTSKSDRKKAVLTLLHAGSFFGEASLGIQHQRISTVTSLGQSTITRVEKAVFRQKMDRDREFGAKFTEYLLVQIARFEADLVDHFFNHSEKRLARILLTHRGLAQTLKGAPSPFQLSQTTLAEMVGTTRSRVSVFMKEFQGKGYIRYNGGLEVDSERLTTFLET
jgi:CRP-like cAMP-binding protein